MYYFNICILLSLGHLPQIYISHFPEVNFSENLMDRLEHFWVPIFVPEALVF